MRTRVGLIARAGQLRVPEERAVALIHAVGTGTVSTLLATAEEERDPSLSQLALDGLLAVLVDQPVAASSNPAATLAIGLRAHVDETTSLSPGERLLLGELLDRLAG